MRRPKVNTNPVANQYASPGERIIEYSTHNAGGLISIRPNPEGTGLIVEVYRHDANVEVRVGEAR